MITLSAEILARQDMLWSRGLEFGCGTGRHLVALQHRGAHVLAWVDMSEGMLAVASSNSGRNFLM